MSELEKACGIEPETEIVDTMEALADGTVGGISNERDLSDIAVKNPRIGKVLKLQEEAERQNEIEKLRSRRIRQEQEYIDKMSLSVEEHLRSTKEEQKYNEEFEERIRYEVYRMHGISEDKLQGMNEYRNAWYQGAAFALFFLSLVLFGLCGILHGFGSEVCIFMAFYTAIGGALLSNGRKQSAFFEVLTKALYLLLFPTMMTVFVCYELGFEEYSYLVPIFTVAGVAVLIIGAVSYFIYDPYRRDRRNRRKANSYIREVERAALKEVRLKEKAYDKLERKKEKQAARDAKKQERETEKSEKQRLREKERSEKEQLKAQERQERKERLSAWWEEKKPRRSQKTRQTEEAGEAAEDVSTRNAEPYEAAEDVSTRNAEPGGTADGNTDSKAVNSGTTELGAAERSNIAAKEEAGGNIAPEAGNSGTTELGVTDSKKEELEATDSGSAEPGETENAELS